MINDWVIFFRLVLAAVLSGVVGFEREYHGRAAGFRTHILVCVGSTLMMLTSMHIFDVYYGKIPCDPARLAAGVITGIGFLGAGTIMQFRSSVRGLTTASSLWVVTGIGLAVGTGLYFGAILTTILAIITLLVFGRLEHIMIRKDWYKTIVIDMQEGIDNLKRVREKILEYEADITDFEVGRSDDGSTMTLKVGLKLANARYVDALMQDITSLAGVKTAKWALD